MRIGYARVSTDDQLFDLQHDALKAAGCTLIFEDRITGTARRRAGLDEALSRVNAGDQLVVWRLDRLGRSLAHLIEISQRLDDRGASFVSLTEGIDTSSDVGDFFFKILGAIAEFERKLIVERTRAGLQAAKVRGRVLGRRKKLNGMQAREAIILMDGGMPPDLCAARFGVGRSTLYRSIKCERSEPQV